MKEEITVKIDSRFPNPQLNFVILKLFGPLKE